MYDTNPVLNSFVVSVLRCITNVTDECIKLSNKEREQE